MWAKDSIVIAYVSAATQLNTQETETPDWKSETRFLPLKTILLFGLFVVVFDIALVDSILGNASNLMTSYEMKKDKVLIQLKPDTQNERKEETFATKNTWVDWAPNCRNSFYLASSLFSSLRLVFYLNDRH